MSESVVNYEVDHAGSREWEETTALVAPSLFGVAAGLILGEMMHASARRGVAIGVGGLGLAAVMPWVVAGVANKINGPASRRGVRRRLRGIRDAGDGVVQDSLDEAGVM
mgnify:CR=1 FL=1